MLNESSSRKRLRGNTCSICRQGVFVIFRGPPAGALEEEAALTDERLQLGPVPEIDSVPEHKITYFDVFDREGHLCPFDQGLIESNQLIYFSGYIKPIYDEDPSRANGVPAQELGPINRWWISGFDGGNSFIIGLSTPYAQYILVEPSPDYQPFMRQARQKALLTKVVMEFLGSSDDPGYEELLSRMQEVTVPDGVDPLDENCLPAHAQFITDQVCEIDDDGEMISTPAMQAIVDLHGTKLSKPSKKKKPAALKLSRATMTPLVSSVFEYFLKGKENYFSYNKTPEKKDLNVPVVQGMPTVEWEDGATSANVNGEDIFVGDFVFVSTRDAARRNRIFRIEHFFRQNFTKQAHCTEYCRGVDTILGESSHPREFMQLDECADFPICKVIARTHVVVMPPPSDWSQFRQYQPADPLDADNAPFFVRKRYLKLKHRFEDLDEENGSCPVCVRRDAKSKKNRPVLLDKRTDGSYGRVRWMDEEYIPGCCVFVEPFAVTLDIQKELRSIQKSVMTIKADEVIYPEIYRKAREVNLTEECPEPFRIAYVTSILYEQKVILRVNKFYRPEDTHSRDIGDVRLLYWTDEEADVELEHVRGRCQVIRSVEPVRDMFYFNQRYDCDRKTFTPTDFNIDVDRTEVKTKKLRTLNPFCGAGGLAIGIGNVAEVEWAVEIDEPTAEAFKLNNPKAKVFHTDANVLLEKVMSGETKDALGVLYPAKGDVEMLIGGPPCQGFSSMNRFTAKQYSQFKNSLIASFLSFCDLYRPKYFVMENVRNFVSFKKSVLLQHAMGCLVAMGYNCTFGVLQGGNFGLAQSRRRMFIVGSAPGLELPEFPRPTHVFLDVDGGGFRSAPMRMLRIRDIVWDLRASGGEGRSQVQDLASKEMSPLNEARIRNVPAARGCDWRDIPNIQVRMRDGKLTDLLRYSHRDRKNGNSRSGRMRGVCACASGSECDPRDRQSNTLIPWCLSHTGNRNNNWSGLYGRLDWDGVFSTVVTNPEPSSKQGRVLHPEEPRVVSVRECARAQGLPDSFRLSGTTMERYRQVGNAVPPPLAAAIGRQIIAAIALAPPGEISHRNQEDVS